MHIRRRCSMALLGLALAPVIAGCAGEADDPGSAPSVEEPPPPAGDADQDPGGTTVSVHRVSEAMAAEVQGSIHVVGLLIDDGSGWRLCELVLESYPPQCGGERLVVDGLDPAELPLEESGGVRWQTDATVVGEIDGDTLTVTGVPASS